MLEHDQTNCSDNCHDWFTCSCKHHEQEIQEAMYGTPKVSNEEIITYLNNSKCFWTEWKASMARLTDKQVDEIASVCGAYQSKGIYYCGVEEGYAVIRQSELKKKLEQIINNEATG